LKIHQKVEKKKKKRKNKNKNKTEKGLYGYARPPPRTP